MSIKSYSIQYILSYINFKIVNNVNIISFQLKDLQMQLCFAEDNYCRVTKDFNKTQEQLIKITKREADLQECLTNMVLIIFKYFI